MRRLILIACVGWCLSFAELAQALNTNFWQLPGEFVDEFDHHAKLDHWKGDLTIVSMEYSECKFVCSSNWLRLLDIQTEADRQHIALNVLIVSLDPAHDTPAAWREYRKVRGLARQNWNFLTGNRASTDGVIKFLGVNWWYFNDFIMHDFRVVKLNPQGAVRTVLASYDVSPHVFLLER